MTHDTFFSKLPVNLNKQQQEAIKSVEGPILLLAVPGSGKTTVLVARLGYMLFYKGIDPSSIITLTYTVAATNDMRERFRSFFGDELADKMEFRTINGICDGIIKEHGRRLGKPTYTLETNENVLMGILSRLYQKYEEEYPTESDLKDLKTTITYIKNMMLSQQEIVELENNSVKNIYNIYIEYCNEMKQRKLMDYDDQLKYAYNILNGVPEMLEFYQNKYLYVCVDESQDTSKIQHEIIKTLTSKHENIFMVGDEDQSIYGFRAAYPEALLEFEKKHKRAKVLLMEENYRSNANIVVAADNFIQKNSYRHEKHMKATKAAGSSIKKVELESKGGQYTYLLKVASDCREQTAVLYRYNESVVPLVDLLERKGVPFNIKKAELSFFTDRVVNDIQNIMKFANDFHDIELFKKIYYKLNAYLDKKTVLKACEISRKYGISIFAALFGHFTLTPNMRTNLKSLELHFSKLIHEPPLSAINRILYKMGYSSYITQADIGIRKVDIMKIIAGRENTVIGFLDRIEKLKQLFQNKVYDNNCKLILSTIHSSKGLEYENVYMIDIEDGIFPVEVPKDLTRVTRKEKEAYEEERRVFYVGITRAKKNLTLFSTNENSVFLTQLFEKEEKNKNSSSITISKPNNHMNSLQHTQRCDWNKYVASLKLGATVIHKKFGTGIIIGNSNGMITIKFRQKEKVFDIKILFDNNLLKIK